jgi:putative ABC transport system substrate-binding protein
MSVQELEAAARAFGIGIHAVGVRGPSDFARAFSETGGDRALIVVASSSMFTERARIADLALKHRLPTALGAREYVEVGGLFSYSVNYAAQFRRAASYVDRVQPSPRIFRSSSPRCSGGHQPEDRRPSA